MPKSKTIARIDREKFKQHLGSMKIVDFHELLVEEDGIQIEYQTFSSLLSNTNSWNLTYAMLVCKRLNLKVEELFYLEPNED